MPLKLMFKLLSIVLVMCMFSSIATAIYADNENKNTPTIVDFDSTTFIRSDGSVWVLRGEQLIPTQIVEISNATKLVEKNFIYTADGKNFALNLSYDVVVPIELEVTGEIKRVLTSYFITTSGKVYGYYINPSSNLGYSQEATFSEVSLPFLVEDLIYTLYGDYLFLSKDGEVWVGEDSIYPNKKIGQEGVRYTQLFNLGAIDENEVIWKYTRDYSTNTSTFSPINSSVQIQEINFDSNPIVATTKDAKNLFFTHDGWTSTIFHSPNTKFSKVETLGSNYYYLTTDHKLYLYSFESAVLIAENVLDFSYHLYRHIPLIYLTQDGKFHAWPSNAVKKKNERVLLYYTDKTSHDIQTPISVFVNNKLIPMPKGAWLLDNTTYLPLRSIFTHLGAQVSWDNSNKIATFSLKDNGNDKLVSLNFLKQEVSINNVKVPFEQELFIDENSAYVPLRLVSEGLGATVSWDSKTDSIYINKK